jgi:hypothetical protein
LTASSEALYPFASAMAQNRLRLAPVLAASLFFAATTALSSSAFAFEKFTVGGGLMAAIGGEFMDKPSDLSAPGADSYPGFGGFMGPAGGFFLEGRALGIIGLEIDVLRQNDRGHADLTASYTSGGVTVSSSRTVEIGQKAWHVPVLLKATLPSPLFAPSIMLGPEFVSPDAGEFKVTRPAGQSSSETAAADSYTMFTFGLGGEFKLPIPSVDLRIPFSLRGSVRPGAGNTLADRAKVVDGHAQFNSAWRYQALATLGVAAHF